MHVQIKFNDKNGAVQHTYDVSVHDVGARQVKPWTTEINGITPEPITPDITGASATADCQDQH